MLDLFSRLAGVLLALGFSFVPSVPAALAVSGAAAAVAAAPFSFRIARAARGTGTRSLAPLGLLAVQLPLSIGFFRLLRSLPATTWVPAGSALHQALSAAAAPLVLAGADLGTSLWTALAAGSPATLAVLATVATVWIGLQELERRRRPMTVHAATEGSEPEAPGAAQVRQAMRTMQRYAPWLSVSAALTLPGVLVLWFAIGALGRIVQNEVVQRMVA